MRFLLGVIVGGLIGFGAALWFQGEPPFVSKANPHAADFTIVISNGYLTRHVAPQISNQTNGAVTGVHVTTQQGNVVFVEAKAGALGVGIPVGVELSLKTQNSTIAVNVRSAHLGPVPIPGVFTVPLQDTINGRIQNETQNQSFRIVSAGTTKDGVRVGLDER